MDPRPEYQQFDRGETTVCVDGNGINFFVHRARDVWPTSDDLHCTPHILCLSIIINVLDADWHYQRPIHSKAAAGALVTE